jgi:hypothetical protein
MRLIRFDCLDSIRLNLLDSNGSKRSPQIKLLRPPCFNYPSGRGSTKAAIIQKLGTILGTLLGTPVGARIEHTNRAHHLGTLDPEGNEYLQQRSDLQGPNCERHQGSTG